MLTLVRLFVFFGGLLVLALFAALIGPYFIDWTNYREAFEREASRILGQKVRVLGRADARLVPFPSVAFDDVVVGEGRDGEPMMTIDRFSMDAELAPFLSGEIRIFDMRIENPTATVRLSEEGELDWALRSEKALPAAALVLENIGVVNGVLTVLDDQNGRRHIIDGLNMQMAARSVAGPWTMEGAARVNGIEGAFSLHAGKPLEDGDIRLRARVLPVAHPIAIELEGNARIEALRPVYAGNFAVETLQPPDTASEGTGKGKRSRRPAHAEARGVFAVDNERLRIESYRLETGTPDNPYVISGEATFDTGRNPEFLLIADGQQLNVDRMGQAPDEEDAPARSLDERLSALRGLLAWAPVPQMPGRVTAALPAIVAGDTTIRDVVIDARPDGAAWRIDRMEAKLPGRTQFLAEGRLVAGPPFSFLGDIVVASNQPSGFAAWLTSDVDPAIRRLEAAGLSAKVDLSPQLQRFEDMEIAVGSAILNGSLERVVPREGRPSLTVFLGGGDVDLDAMRALVSLVVGGENGDRLAGHDIGARLSADRFSAMGVTARGADLDLRLKGDTLDIDRLSLADIAGASISSVGRLDNVFGQPEGELDLNITAERSDRALALLSHLAGSHPILDHLAAHASLFDGAAIDLQAGFSRQADGKAVLLARARGEAGGSGFDLTLERTDALAPLASGPLSIAADISTDSPRALLAQMGVGLLPIDLVGPAAIDLQLDGVPAEGLAFSIHYGARDGDVRAVGTARQDEDRRVLGTFALTLRSDDLWPYLASGGINLVGPGTALPTDMTVNVTMGPDAFLLQDIDGMAASTVFSGTLALARGDGFDASGALAVSRVDLGWMAETILGPDTVLTGGGGWSEREFLSPLQTGVTLDLDVRAERVDLHIGAEAGPWSGRLVLQGNELQWRDIEAEWLGGTVSGGLRLANLDGSGFLSGDVRVAGAELAPLMWRRDGFPVANGTMDLSMSFEGGGKSVRALAASMTGSGVLQAAALELDGLENEALPQILSVADGDGFEAEGDAVLALAERVISNGSFFAGDASVPFTIAAGTVRLPNIVLTDSGADIRGEARLDMPEQAVEARFDLEFHPETEELTGAVPSVNLAFLGPLSDPDRMIDAAELSNYLALRAYERERRRVETLQAVVLENQRLRREAALYRQRTRLRQQAAEQSEADEAGSPLPGDAPAVGGAAPVAGQANDQVLDEDFLRQLEEAVRQAGEHQGG